MKPLDIYKRHLQLSRPTDHNMWKLYDRTAQNLDLRGVKLSYDEWGELENAYQDFIINGTPLVD